MNDILIRETETHLYYETGNGIGYCVPKNTFFLITSEEDEKNIDLNHEMQSMQGRNLEF